jgi:hypothetical protein
MSTDFFLCYSMVREETVTNRTFQPCLTQSLAETYCNDEHSSLVSAEVRKKKGLETLTTGVYVYGFFLCH